jgi:hypothetical protein
MPVQLQLKNVKGRDHMEDPSLDGKIILKWIVRKYGPSMLTGFIWLWIVAGGRLLLTQ